MRICILLFSILLLTVFPVSANNGMQQSYSLQNRGSSSVFNFGWTGSDGRTFNTMFSLPIETVNAGQMEFRNPNEVRYVIQNALNEGANNKYKAELNQLIFKRMSDLTYKIRDKVEFYSSDGNLSYRFGTRVTKEEQEQIEARLDYEAEQISKEYIKKKTAEYWRSHLYNADFDENRGLFVVSPDYPQIVKRYTSVMRNVAESLRRTAPLKSREGLISHSIEFIQSIPYSTEFNNQANFQTPIGMFVENKGDCDTKTIALAAILKNYGIESIVIKTKHDGEGHALMGINIVTANRKHAILHNGVPYIPVETTTTGHKLGELQDDLIESLKKHKETVKL